jgi:hypothetical protein
MWTIARQSHGCAKSRHKASVRNLRLSNHKPHGECVKEKCSFFSIGTPKPLGSLRSKSDKLFSREEGFGILYSYIAFPGGHHPRPLVFPNVYFRPVNSRIKIDWGFTGPKKVAPYWEIMRLVVFCFFFRPDDLVSMGARGYGGVLNSKTLRFDKTD